MSDGNGLTVDQLSVWYDETQILHDVSLRVRPGEIHAVVGESGAGKTTLAHAISGLLSHGARDVQCQITGRVVAGGHDMVQANQQTRPVRPDVVSIAMQDGSFNPVIRLGDQIGESLRLHGRLRGKTWRDEVDRLVSLVGLPPEVVERFPHQISGGQRRRAGLATALALSPNVLVLDESTSGLDPVSARDILESLRRVIADCDMATVFVTHDLCAAHALADSASVLYAGHIIEQGPAEHVVGRSKHPYTAAAISAMPVMNTTRDLLPIRGVSPAVSDKPSGCVFHPRCSQTVEECLTQIPTLDGDGDHQVSCHRGGIVTRLRATGLHKSLGDNRTGTFTVTVDDITVQCGESVGIIGASGSGKTTVAQMLSGHIASDRDGQVRCDDQPVRAGWVRSSRREPGGVQLIVQDPWAAFSPRRTLRDSLREALHWDADRDQAADDTRIARVLDDVGLSLADRVGRLYPHHVSGGQLQRLNVARALLAEPTVLIADEPTSMVDPSEQARLAVMLRQQQVERGMSLVIISHDVPLVRKMTDRLVVLDAGVVVEIGPTEQICSAPRSAAARRLVEASPRFSLSTLHLPHEGKIYEN